MNTPENGRPPEKRVMEILGYTKQLAKEYRALTGKPLGVTGEIAEYEAARILDVKLTPARQAGYDALEHKNGETRRMQIKGRCLLQNCKPGQPLGSIDVTKDWDAVFWFCWTKTLKLPKFMRHRGMRS